MSTTKVTIQIAATFIVLTQTAFSAVIFQTATLAAPGSIAGVKTFVNLDQFIGTRFELATPVHVTEVGGHFEGEGEIFGAIVSLDDIDDLPDYDLTTGVLGTTLITLFSSSNDRSGSMDLLLPPGAYAVVFGSGKFGATGGGMVPTWNGTVGWPTVIFRNGAVGGWHEAFDSQPGNKERFFVSGEIIPEPTTACLAIAVMIVGLSGRTKSE